MTQARLNLMVRVVSRRVAAGEDIDAVMSSYPGLTVEEAQEIRDAVNALQA